MREFNKFAEAVHETMRLIGLERERLMIPILDRIEALFIRARKKPV